MLVDKRWEGRVGLLDKWTCRMGTSMLERDRDELDVISLVLRVKLLPPGQLFAAASPRSPEEQ